MAHATDDFAEALKAAREARALSQRALGQSVGLPQSHISKIEAGTVDLKLSSLVELARALDLDVMLVPRKLVPAVRSIIRNAEPAADRASEQRGVREVRRLQALIGELQKKRPDVPQLRRLNDTVRDLINIRLGPGELARVQELHRLLKRVEAGKGNLEDAFPLAEDLRDMRNRLVHNMREPPARRPAYALDDGEGDA